MALVFKDRVKVTSTTTGTGTLTLGSAVSGFQDFSVIGNGNTTYYTITDQSGNWEVGVGTYTSSGTTLSRDTILESSNSGSAVDFPSGTKTVFVTYPAGKSVTQDASGNVTLQGVLTPSGGISNGATFVKTGSGGEGGELHLEKGATSTLSGDVVVDAYNQSVRIFENGGTNRGAQLDVSAQSAGVGSTILTSSTSAATFPTLNQNTTGTAAGLSSTLAIASGGTGQTSASAAFNALSPITSTGDLILGNGTNSATRLAIGANNTYLKSNGSTASWAAVSAGALTLISTQTASSSATLSWTGLSGYNAYLLVLDHLIPESIVSLYMQIGTGSGPTYITSNYDSACLSKGVTGTTIANYGGQGLSQMRIAEAVDATANRGCSGDFYLTGMNSGSDKLNCNGTAVWWAGSSTYTRSGLIASQQTSTVGPYTAIKVYFSSGNIASGRASLYGIST